MRTVGRALPALCLLIAWWGAAPSSTDAQDRTKRGTVPLTPSGTVLVDNHEGVITLQTWDRNAVKYEAAVRPEDDADHPEATVVKVDSAADRYEVRTEYDKSKGGDGGFWGGGPEVRLSTQDAACDLRLE